MLSTRLAVAGLALAVAAAPAMAQSRGWMEFGGLGTYTNFDGSYNFDNGGGVGGRIGVYLHPMFELEGEGSYMDIDRNGVEFRPGAGTFQANYTPLYLRGTAHFPTSMWGAALTAGAGITRTSYRYTYNWGPSAAVGVKIPVFRYAALRLDVVGDYLPTPKTTNVNFRAGLSVFRRPALNTIIDRIAVADDSELIRLRNDRARLDSIADAYNRLRDSLATAPGCNCPAPAPEPIPTTKDRVPTNTQPIQTQKDRRVP
jgi:hypothetical protein